MTELLQLQDTRHRQETEAAESGEDELITYTDELNDASDDWSSSSSDVLSLVLRGRLIEQRLRYLSQDNAHTIRAGLNMSQLTERGILRHSRLTSLTSWSYFFCFCEDCGMLADCRRRWYRVQDPEDGEGHSTPLLEENASSSDESERDEEYWELEGRVGLMPGSECYSCARRCAIPLARD